LLNLNQAKGLPRQPQIPCGLQQAHGPFRQLHQPRPITGIQPFHGEGVGPEITFDAVRVRLEVDGGVALLEAGCTLEEPYDPTTPQCMVTDISTRNNVAKASIAINALASRSRFLGGMEQVSLAHHMVLRGIRD
jgi:hypothetical protein